MVKSILFLDQMPALAFEDKKTWDHRQPRMNARSMSVAARPAAIGTWRNPSINIDTPSNAPMPPGIKESVEAIPAIEKLAKTLSGAAVWPMDLSIASSVAASRTIIRTCSAVAPQNRRLLLIASGGASEMLFITGPIAGILRTHRGICLALMPVSQ